MLNFFKDVQIQPQYSTGEDERLVDLVFDVDERPTGQASVGAGYSDRDKMVGQIGLQVPNFRGMGQSLDFNWEFGTRREQFLVGFTEPWLFDSPTSLSARAYTQNIQYYDYRSTNYRLNNSDILWKSNRKSINVRVGRRLKKPAIPVFHLAIAFIAKAIPTSATALRGLRTIPATKIGLRAALS